MDFSVKTMKKNIKTSWEADKNYFTDKTQMYVSVVFLF